MQPLGTAKEKLLADYGRRINATHIAYGEGILVCPTNAGVILGVDLLTHSLLWRTPTATPRSAAAADPDGPSAAGCRTRRRPPAQPNQPIVTDWKAAADHRRRQGGLHRPRRPRAALPQPAQRRPGLGAKRSDGDVYLGGVFAGRVVIVGKKDVRA